jgi:hypothetical protein
VRDGRGRVPLPDGERRERRDARTSPAVGHTVERHKVVAYTARLLLWFRQEVGVMAPLVHDQDFYRKRVTRVRVPARPPGRCSSIGRAPYFLFLIPLVGGP